MRFGSPYMAAWGWLIPAVILFFILAGRSRRRTMERFAARRSLEEISGNFDAGKLKLRSVIFTLSVVFMVVALMRPQWGFQWQEVKREGLDILIALDTSKSMLAEDVLPNRLERAKLAIKDLVKKLHGDRIGLVVFSGTAFLQCPLTVDYNGFLLTLDDVDVDTIPVGGTSLSNAIITALDSYEGGKNQDKVLIMITDGEDLEGGVEAAVQKAKAHGVKIFCVGIGSSEGELIPLDEKTGRREFMKDSDGKIVKTRLVEDTLQKIVIETGGMYVHATGAEFGLTLIYDEGLSKLQKQEFEAKMEKRYYERFQIPLAVAIILLLIEPVIGDRRREGKIRNKVKSEEKK